MYFMLLEVKETIKDFFGNIGRFFRSVFGGMLIVLNGLFVAVRYILFKILCVIMTITSIGFLFGLFLLYKNVKECMNMSIAFTSTEYFSSMVVLLGLHIVIFVASMIAKPKDI